MLDFMHRNRPFPYVEIGGDFSFRFPVLIQTKNWKNVKNDANMWKIDCYVLKLYLPKMWKVGPGHISEGTVSNYWNIQAREGPENTKGKSLLVFTAFYWPQGWKNDTIKFGRPICNPCGQCSSIYLLISSRQCSSIY
jgi:hypothetical protein